MAGKNQKYLHNQGLLLSPFRAFYHFSPGSINPAFSDSNFTFISSHLLKSCCGVPHPYGHLSSRLCSDFKHPDLHSSALPPGTSLIPYSHASGLLNSAKRWICHQSNISYIYFAGEIACSRNRFYTDTLPCVLQA